MRAPEIVDHDSEESENEWEYVLAKTGKPLHLKNLDQIPDTGDSGKISHPNLESLISKIMNTVNLLESLLDREIFWERYEMYFSEPIDAVVAYGMGSFENSIVSRFQLAFLIALAKHTKPNALECFDPAMTITDMEIAKEFGVIPAALDNEEPPSVRKNVLVFMPHCDRVLHEWVLLHKLSSWHITFISNYFTAYAMEHPMWEAILPSITVEPFLVFQKDYTETIARKSVRTKQADKSREIPQSAFNDTAIQKVDPSSAPLIVEILNSLHKSLS